MGGKDIGFLAACTRPAIVSFVGPHDAGKTTLLAAMFLAVFDSGDAPGNLGFAGSYSLSAWHDVSAFMTLDAEGASSFPPHTPDSDARVPGLLHLAFQDGACRRDLLFADAPGEWYSRWAREPSAAGSKGAAWVTTTARRNLLVADSAALSGDERFSAREQFDRLVGRLADATGRSNTALVWTKSDLEVSDTMRNHVESNFARHFGDAPVFRTQIPVEGGEIVEAQPAALMQVLEWTLQKPDSRTFSVVHNSPADDPFLAYGAAR
ncbi:TRAFAC clade GTPase domain-containing protein [Euryhalocaulis caribicus]|uniref:TRAFAC clade GTPase domain-containing protein n=1 Tax=Euryhalocaulis caribicus TaxID=1161401 RepID=UPI0003B30BC3|nr:hypothetical protein [Euryhalocaulis caribicus]